MSPMAPPYQRWRGFFLLIVCVSILVWGIESWRRSTPDITTELPGTAEAETVSSPVVQPLEQPLAQSLAEGESVSGSTSRNDENSAPLTPDPNAKETLAGQPLSESMPSLQTIRSEVEKDPHTTPEAILQFSVAISRRLNSAVGTEAGAKALFSELEDCVLNPKQKGLATVQALCLLNAHRLAVRYPSLEPREDELAKKSDPEAIRRAHSLY